jgi:malate dehydrogenase (oxaloacetate-decarboxylating)(NADP+)
LRQAALITTATPNRVSDPRDQADGKRRDLARAYSPGVAEACLEIKKQPRQRWNTPHGAIWSQSHNGSAVLGLGNTHWRQSRSWKERRSLFKKLPISTALISN